MPTPRLGSTRYAIVGTGSRATMYIDAICGQYAAHCELVALCDTSLVRMAYHNKRLTALYDRDEVPSFPAANFAAMLEQRRPDVVIVTTVDAFHHVYIVAAMEHGCDVITEKPMTIDAEKVGAVLSAVEQTHRRLTVTFNYRYAPGFTRLRQLIAEGAIGVPRLVDFSWMLDTSHGADYFRRWHREKPMSGGLLVHKASHHFDLVNWWAGSWPETVYALGSLAFYGRKAAAGRGQSYANSRCTGNIEGDPFALDLDRSEMLRGLYRDAEEETGYVRDRNVFGDDISIEDTMVVSARYRGGALLSYALVAYSPWEGLRVAITGDQGRVELYERHGAHVIEETPTGTEAPYSPGASPQREILLFPMFGGPVRVDIPAGKGPHGGDAYMLEQLFGAEPPADPWGWRASHLDGAASVLLGAAANRSIGTGNPVAIEDLGVTLPQKP
ncbi:MAG: Gfo/Idh/MocA family oxidoreductase [Acidimicrobiales bacterium]